MESDSNSAKPTLVDRLRSFNRKERYWVIRNALGVAGQPIPLSPQFRETLQKTINRPIPEDAWWGMDYHINWLFATAFLLNDADRRNGINKTSEGKYLIKGNQEDVDLIVAFEKNIILLEAKFNKNWSKKQMESKANRLDMLKKEFGKNAEIFIVFWAPEIINSRGKLTHENIKMELWTDRDDSGFWLINREKSNGANWVIKEGKR